MAIMTPEKQPRRFFGAHWAGPHPARVGGPPCSRQWNLKYIYIYIYIWVKNR